MLRSNYYKDLLIGTNCDEYDIIYFDSYNPNINNIINNTLHNYHIYNTNYFIYNNNDIMTNFNNSDVIDKIIDIEEYKICLFILMTKCKRLFFISPIYNLWKKSGIINILEDFYNINVIRISY
jgi:hypothetical protein